MANLLRADPAYAAELRVAIEADGATEELAILDRQLANIPVQVVADHKPQRTRD
ncbi:MULTISPECIES: hypothetical protein [Pseudomonas]|uniref:hypothetical protein n=1 Tax=Pseudomonas TaxID=286 RepID=UPI0021D09B00|nr:hypothetical protein [Pseudomonas proteolytica]